MAMTEHGSDAAMDDRRRPDHLSQLPAELRSAVASFATGLNEMKSLVLVSKAWSDIALPFLWATLKSDLVQAGSRRDVKVIASTKSNIIKHIRSIHILAAKTAQYDDHLPALLTAIPRGQFLEFHSDRQIQQSTLDVLLRLHSKLEILELVNGKELAKALESPWVEGCFSSLTILAARPTTTFARDAVVLHEDDFASPQASPLPSATTANAASQSVDHLPALKLRTLGIRDIILPGSLTTMFKRIDALALRELTVDTVPRTSSLLGALASLFSKNEPAPRKLHVLGLGNLDSETSNLTISNMLLLLTSFCGLENLKFQCQNVAKLSVDGIVNHGETPRSLFIVNGTMLRADRTRCYDAADLQAIATACPELEYLCLNLYEIDQDRSESDILGSQPSGSLTPNAFGEALTAIASMPKLHTLRLTNPPNYRKAHSNGGKLFAWHKRTVENGFERYAFRARADALMQYLGERGSKVNRLAFSPVDVMEKAERPDEHGHVWPDYFYSRERLVDDAGAVSFVARPIGRF